DTAEHTEEYATRGHEDIQRQTAAHQFDEARGHLVRGRHEGGIDEAAVVDAVPACQQDKPGGKDESRSTHVSSKCFCSLWLKHPKRTMYRMFDASPFPIGPCRNQRITYSAAHPFRGTSSWPTSSVSELIREFGNLGARYPLSTCSWRSSTSRA